MSLQLYKIADEYRQANEFLLKLEGDIPLTAIQETIDGLAGDLEYKALNVAAFYKNLEKEMNAMKDYMSEMRERLRKCKNYADRLKEYLKINLEKCNITKINGSEFSITIRNSPGTIVIDNANQLPKDFITGILIQANKLKIKQAIKDNVDVPGAHMEGGTTIIIK